MRGRRAALCRRDNGEGHEENLKGYALVSLAHLLAERLDLCVCMLVVVALGALHLLRTFRAHIVSKETPVSELPPVSRPASTLNPVLAREIGSYGTWS